MCAKNRLGAEGMCAKNRLGAEEMCARNREEYVGQEGCVLMIETVLGDRRNVC